MNLKYNEYGCLFEGVYELSLEDVENEFVKDNSQRRRDIFDYYKSHLNDIKSTGFCLNHWIDGSFVTLKENPNDIDTLTEFDGVKIKELCIMNEIEHIIYDASLWSENFCHSFCVFKVPKNFGEDYEEYMEIKTKVLFCLFPVDYKNNKLQGFVKLKSD